MALQFTPQEIIQTIKMVQQDDFDIRTVTLGINLLPCADKNIKTLCENIEKKIKSTAKDLVSQSNNVSEKYGVPIINKRITVTPISLLLESVVTGNIKKDITSAVRIAKTLDTAAKNAGVDFIGGYGGFMEKGMTYADKIIIESLPEVFKNTDRVCAFLNVATFKAGINMKVVAKMGAIIHDIAHSTPKAIGCAKLVVFANAVSDNPFMAGGFHGIGEPDTVINVGISGPGVVRNALEHEAKDATLDEISETIKKTTFKITRAGELIGREVARLVGVRFGIVDLSLAPTTAMGDSVAKILEAMGLEQVGTHGSTAALALLTDAVKKGGLMASSHVGGLSGAFIPVSEDIGMVNAAKAGTLTIDKLEAMTCVCSVGLDMIAVPGNTKTTTLSAIIADEMAIGMVNNKTIGVRIIPVPGKRAGDSISWGGLLGKTVVMPVHTKSSDRFIWRKGQIPPTITSFRN
jgi:hypothetical protein